MRARTRTQARRRRALIAMSVCALVLVIWWLNRTPEPPPPSVAYGPGDALRAEVLWVVDGTTIEVDLHGGQERVGYLGIEPLGPPATEANRHLVQGQHVWLELARPLRAADGRLLAYVSVGDRMVNAELVRQGYAQVATVPPHVKYRELFLARQREAREAKRGLWGATR